METGTGGAFETVIGLEIHVQLRTETKLFCGCAPRFGDAPNTHVCPVCLGLPGALPVANGRAIHLSTVVALALGCDVAERSVFARKNYFYPDLPKGYQISQYERPIGLGGRLEFWTDGELSSARIHRVHLEEDAGKSIHDADDCDDCTLIDLNRCGTPLLEIVTDPDLRDPTEATDFLGELRTTLLQLGVTDASMEEGSLRCDANISLRERGATALNPKTEIKNLNSFRFLRAALRHEQERQAAMLQEGEVPPSATRLWDERRGRTVAMRAKEQEQDYRYFPDPDLVPIAIGAADVAAARSEVTEAPVARARRYVEQLGLAVDAARELAAELERAVYFEQVVDAGAPPASAANWIRGPLAGWLNERSIEMSELRVEPTGLAELLTAIDEGVVSGSAAKQVFRRMAEEGGSAAQIIAAEGLQQVGDRDALRAVIDEVLVACSEETDAYRAGRQQVLGALIGAVMKRTEGRADPRLTRELLIEMLQR